MRRLLACALVLAPLAACRPPENPADTYRRFAAALRSERPEVVESAWGLLSEGSRRALDARAQALAAAAPGVSSSGQELLVGALPRTAPPVKSVTVVQESAGAARVRVEDEAGASGEVELRREGGAWKVVLPAA